ncbi:hypothetical protein GCM10011583_53130 [Streptomyces camponoticapitis]|uniref:HNH domain-containing protein n=1 Tax=Streptomyces camponoticapitis TaxID=1616125 RepID=A0ABQ2EJY7_9ACTN|nr:HNH endonuclease [Streptomyces camponoticapitis]GGK14539.1 hypothetical protein GCM10011583_53130 [Streptomyces camponoticapitis]
MSPSKRRNRQGRGNAKRRRELRGLVAERDGLHCHYCRVPLAADLSDSTLDHYIPWALWRVNLLCNLVLACEPCNARKDDALPVVFVWLLLRAAAVEPGRFEVAA